MTATELDRAVDAWDNPGTVAPRGTVVVISGRGEHPGVYERFGTRIAFDGYRVRAVGDPTVDPEAVTARVTELLADDSLPAPRVLAGSDGGALFAAALVATGRVTVDALILAGLPVAPAVAAESTPGSGSVDLAADWDGELTERTACPTHRGRLDHDTSIRRGALADPLPAQWFARADLAAVEVPVLGLHGAADTVSPLGPVRELYGHAPNAELVSIVNGRHDALNDATHRTAAANVVEFLERVKAGVPEIAHREL